MVQKLAGNETKAILEWTVSKKVAIQDDPKAQAVLLTWFCGNQGNGKLYTNPGVPHAHCLL